MTMKNELLWASFASLTLLAACGGGQDADGLASSAVPMQLATVGGSFGLTSDANFYTIDTGAGLVFKVRRANNDGSYKGIGDITSMLYNGVQYQDSLKGSQVNSGFGGLYTNVSAVSVSAAQVDASHIKVTVTSGDLTHYYLVRRGENKIYMGTYFATEPSALNLVRYIVRVPIGVLPNGPAPSDIRNNTGAIEASDVFGLANGETRSKHYSNMRLKDWSYFGATGKSVGMWMVRDNNEGNSGGPFYRSLLDQGTDTDQELTYIVNYGEAQTEAFRTGVLNTYTLVFTDGSAPGAVDTSWFGSMGLNGYVAPSQRGGVASVGIAGRDTRYKYTVGFSNAQAQYWTAARDTDGYYNTGSTAMIPGTYTMTIYKNELAVDTRSVTVTAGATKALNTITITGDPSSTTPVWRIGDWDGTPREFLNGDKVTTMHPSDVRMASWTTPDFVVGTSNPATGFPAYQWQKVNGTITINFNLAASQLVDSTLRVGITTAYANGRPAITVNGWSAPIPAASTQPGTRTLTIGSYRGNNNMFTYNIPASALVAGTNTLNITVASGSGGTGFLSAGYSFDAIDLIPAQ